MTTQKIEYRVKTVTRHIVTRYEQGAGVTTIGEYGNEDEAYKVGNALAFAEREELGWPPGDERMQFPDRHGSAA